MISARTQYPGAGWSGHPCPPPLRGQLRCAGSRQCCWRALLLALSVLLGALAPQAGAADERILAYRSDIRVERSGELSITETIRVRAEGRDIRRGIYRDFPTAYRDRWGNHVKVDFIPIAVRRNGQDEAWHTEKRSNGVRVYFGSADRLLPVGIHEYTFSFTSNRQLGFFDHHDELYFNVIGTGWMFPIDHAVATIRLPFTVPADQMQLAVYSGSQGSHGADARIEALAGDLVHVETSRALQPGEGLTVALGWPKGFIAEPSLTTRTGWFLSDNGAAIVLLLGLLVPLAWYSWAWNRVGRDPAKGVIIPRFEPPRGLSPAACRYLCDMSFNRDVFTAAIISLAVKGWLNIEEQGKSFSLQRTASKRGADLTVGERAVLERLLPRPGSRLALDQENHQDFQTARTLLERALKKEYLGRLFKQNTIWLAPPILTSAAAAAIAVFFDGAVAVWIIFAASSLLLHAAFLHLMRSPTPAGRRVMDEIDGFRRYLDTAEQDRLERMRSPALTPEVFEAFLPYAYALRVENSWCQRFAREMPQQAQAQAAWQPGWYHGRSGGLAALHHLGGNFSSSFSAAVSAASSPPGSSSGSGGGGSSGGGGGGGGGGGW